MLKEFIKNQSSQTEYFQGRGIKQAYEVKLSFA